MAVAAARAIGVDFGTSTSLVAEQVGRQPVDIAALGRSTPWFPSIAGYRGNSLLIGEDADALPPEQVIRSIKRAITERRETIQLTSDEGIRELRADDVIVALLSELAKRASGAGHPLDVTSELRLGCPAMWDGPQRARLLGLAAEAGLPVQSSALVDEPIAAGVSWITHRFSAYRERPEGRLLVFDMGGGTLDIAVLDVFGGEAPEISVLSSLGIAQAGDALDQEIAEDLGEELARRGFNLDDLPRPDRARTLVLREARAAKIRLSGAREERIVFRGMSELPVLSYSRERLEEAFAPQMEVAEALVWAAIREAKLTEQRPSSSDQANGLQTHSPSALRAMGPDLLANEIQYVLLVGGMSRIPYVERRIGALFPEAQVFDNAGVEPEEAIVAGLADTTEYERINLHRPGFDFVLEWEESGERRHELLYAAHAPLYNGQQAFTMAVLAYELRGRDFPGLHRGVGVIRVRSTSGEFVRLRVGGQLIDGVRVQLCDGMVFKIYPDGRILIRDGSGRDLNMRVDRWPVIRGRDFAELVLKQEKGQIPISPDQWYLDKFYGGPPRK